LPPRAAFDAVLFDTEGGAGRVEAVRYQAGRAGVGAVEGASRWSGASEPEAPASEWMIRARMHSLTRRARNEAMASSCGTEA
jgi:hypothetical protein